MVRTAILRLAPASGIASGQTPDPDELFAYRREHLAPHYWTVLEEFPLSPSGKIQKFVLRERFLAWGPDVAIRAGSTDIAAAAHPLRDRG
jgi:hypothetical protein